MVEDGRVYWCRNSIEFSCVKQSCWAATLDWRVPHYGYISSQVKPNFLVENSNSKYHQIVDGFPGVPKGSCLESATFWAAVQEWRKPALQYKNLFRNAMLSLIDYISQEPWGLILGDKGPCPPALLNPRLSIFSNQIWHHPSGSWLCPPPQPLQSGLPPVVHFYLPLLFPTSSPQELNSQYVDIRAASLGCKDSHFSSGLPLSFLAFAILLSPGQQYYWRGF